MKKLIILGCLSILATGLLAQNDGGAKVVTVSQAKQNEEGADGNKYTFQVGVPYTVSENNNYVVRFPWDIKYLYGTFAEESFDVSKGYFGDKILIGWELRNNYDLITSLKIYRREYTDAGSNGYVFVSNVSRDETQYEDQYVEGGVLYEYKIVAAGVDPSEIKYTNFITGIGFRNPTAIVTGNVSYEGGNPVKDVTIVAESDGAATNLGSALKIPNNGFLDIRDMSREITTTTTLQAWLKPETAFVGDTGAPIRLFRLKESTNTLDVNVKLLAASNALEVNIDGAIYILDTYFPSGSIDPRGDDVLVPVSDFNTNYVHFSIQIVDGQVPVLFVNGRAINADYSALMLSIENEDETSVYEGFNVIEPTTISTLTNIEAWTNVHVGGDNTAFIDEIRIWDAVIEDNIRTDYRRYISGNDARLISYLSANEGAGDFAYDISRTGFDYNKNNGRLRLNAADANAVLWENYNAAIPGSSNNIPNASQLGVLGVTDVNGNYEITSIPYSGTGESFTITPLFNGHQFDPSQQLIFLGQGSEVVNQINFLDLSSFIFKGKVLFDTRGVFPSWAEVYDNIGNGNTIAGGAAIEDVGYNQYEKLGEFFDKGAYWLNDAGTPEDRSDDYLDKYSKIPSQGVQIFIDGQLVLDENNEPELTDDLGEFEINVPIGNHFIKLEKDGYEFEFNGRFPAETGTFYEFFEDALNQVVFIDNTRITAVGRVVGGAVEAQKTIGFGGEGTYAPTYTDAEGLDQNYEVSSINNIGAARITFEYAPFNKTRFVFETNADTGEYRKDILPLNYKINQIGGVRIINNTDIRLLDADETLNAAIIDDLITPEFTYPNGEAEEGDAYHYVKNFIYRSKPKLQVIEQTSDTEVVLNAGDPDEVSISTEDFTHPVYSQFSPYEITLSSFERYSNFDSGSEVEDLVPIVDGELVITNNLALPNSETVVRSDIDPSIIVYSFRAGIPNVFAPFTNTVNIFYDLLDQTDPEGAADLITTGVILGGQADSEQAFITTAPEIPDIILRDPPGSNSFASIQEGESITFTKSNDFTSSGGFSRNTTVSTGADFAFGGGLAGPVFEADLTVDGSLGLGVSTSSKTGQELTKTYTFSQAISTSSDPEYVGSEGDLYIGQTNNYYYGSYDNVQASADIIGNADDNLTLTNADDEVIHLTRQKALSFVEEPGATLFVYSQKYIIDTLLEDIQDIITNIDNGISIPGEDGVLERDFYVQQINLWRLTILNNERSKYRALYDRQNLKAETLDVIDAYLGTIEDAIANEVDSPFSSDNFTSGTNIRALIDENFSDNISFDSGVGEITRTIETIVVNNNSSFFNVKLDASIGVTLGVEINGIGVETETSGYVSGDSDSELSQSETATVSVSYTLSDTDPANVLSVDVINMFDGYGPIFSTVGGRTSCPYEGADLSNYYDHAAYSLYLAELQAYITANPFDLYGPDRPEYTVSGLLSADDAEQLSYATQPAEDPQIIVEIAEVFNVPESNNAEFTLLLQNLADANSDAASFNYFELAVVSGTNPFSADINLAANGTVVFIPYGETVEYTLTLAKVAEAQFDYENIMIVVQSRCDPVNVFDQVSISAHFVPTCTEVEISAPLENWVYNNDIAFNSDGSVNNLDITMTGFNQAFNNFKSIDLEYRISGSPTWTRLSTYYNTEEFYLTALGAGETNIERIVVPNLTFPFDIIGLQLQDGDYEFRAKSDCLNGPEYISEVITGSIDVNAPKRFGTPLPIDGILSAGEDLKVSFNENIFYNNAISTIEIKGETNQLPINNSVSLYFNGASNTATIENPRIITGDFSLEFWLKNETIAASATILSQQSGIDVSLNSGQMSFTIGGATVSGGINPDGLFHHYTLTHNNASGDLQIIEDSTVLSTVSGTSNAQFTNSNTLTIGGNTFIGNIHDLRLWSKSLTLSQAASNIFTKIIGNESNLLGFWPMTEGRGAIAYDLAFFKHATVNTSWDIKPKGTSYEFASSQYLELDNVGFVQLNKQMDATISFWVKTSTSQEATLFSNGRGDGTDIVQSNGLANKWAINMDVSGQLSLESEGNSSLLVSENLADGDWHHVAILFNRIGSLRTYLNGAQVSSNQIADIGGFSGNKAWLGARGSIDLSGAESVDREFIGKIDEFRLWNSLRNVDQIDRDRYNEVAIESIGLLLYAKMNAPDPATANGPRYYHAFTNQSTIPSNAVLSSGAVNYANDAPPIKPARQLINFQVSYVINGDEIIIEPVINDWAALEGQILDITVDNMLDISNNSQESPITWTAFVQQNDVDWYAEGYGEVIDLIMSSGEAQSFEVTIVNRGGNTQPYSITDVPSWLTLSSASGSIAPDSEITITATVNSQLSVGDYLENIRLETDFGFDQVLQVDLRVLDEGPGWEVNPNDFDYSMNIVGKIRVDGTFSDDLFDQVAAISDGEVRGVVNLIYQTSYQEYFVFLTVYSNSPSGDAVEFRIWDSSEGNVLHATIGGNATLSFLDNDVVGTLNTAVWFENTDVIEQEIILNEGWTWVSTNVNDLDFSDLNMLTQGMQLETSDRILSHSPSLLETYYKDDAQPLNSSWNGTISSNGGLSSQFMYKMNTTHGQPLVLTGSPVDINSWSFSIQTNWNWVPFPLNSNLQVNEALASFDAQEGNVIKSQNLFAIYDAVNGWSGTLNYLEEGQGYMLKSSENQTLIYPNYFGRSAGGANASAAQRVIAPEFTQYGENMNAVVLMPSGYDNLFVYDANGTLKGQVTSQVVGDKELSFITIYGELPEQLIFHIGNASETKPTTKEFSFKSNQVLGTVADPVILEDETLFGITVSPNPFENHLNIKINSTKSQMVSFQIHNMLGQLVFTEEVSVGEGENDLRIVPNLSLGAYFLNVNVNNNNSVFRVIKN